MCWAGRCQSLSPARLPSTGHGQQDCPEASSDALYLRHIHWGHPLQAPLVVLRMLALRARVNSFHMARSRAGLQF